METIASAVRTMFIRIMRDEIVELQDRAETLRNAEMFDAELKGELAAAYEHLFRARVRADELENGEPDDVMPCGCSSGSCYCDIEVPREPDLTRLTDEELGRELIHARNRRDSHSFGSRRSEEHSATVNRILREQERRRDARRAS